MVFSHSLGSAAASTCSRASAAPDCRADRPCKDSQRLAGRWILELEQVVLKRAASQHPAHRVNAGGQGQQIDLGLRRIVADLPELAIADKQRPVVAIHAAGGLRHLHGHLLRHLNLSHQRDGHIRELSPALGRPVEPFPNQLALEQFAVLVMKGDAGQLPPIVAVPISPGVLPAPPCRARLRSWPSAASSLSRASAFCSAACLSISSICRKILRHRLADQSFRLISPFLRQRRQLPGGRQNDDECQVCAAWPLLSLR